jgi:hypothetical protein
MAEEDLGFQVRDRRRRLDGEAGPSSEPRAEPPRDRPQPGAEPGPPRAGARPGTPVRSLVGLFVMLAGLAARALEGHEDPAAGQRRRDLQQASELIDTLMLLREKTAGHLTAEESQALEELIYDLQMRYVSVAARP